MQEESFLLQLMELIVQIAFYKKNYTFELAHLTLLKMDFVLLLLILISLYIVLILILKSYHFKAKIKSKSFSNCCPNCFKPLDRIRRTKRDQFINIITFQIFTFKRFVCKECNWTGLVSRFTKPSLKNR